MSFMQNIRRSKKATRSWFLALTIVLSVGLVASFAMWSVPQGVSGAGAPQPGAGGRSVAQGQPVSREVELNTRIQQYEAVLRSNQENVPVWKDLGNARYDLGAYYAEQQKQAEADRNFRAAVEAYGKVLEKEPQNVDVRVDRATAAFYSGQNELAEQEFQRAIQDNPKHVYAHFNYGVFLATAKGDKQAARQQWQAVLDLKPSAETVRRVEELLKQYQ